MVTTLIDMTGKKFGRLRVIERAGTIHGQASWLCECECGKEVIVRGYCLRTGETASCGCLAAEMASSRLKKHGMTKTRLFKTWTGMLERCYRTYHKSYKDYGGRGITICDEWKNDFSAFYSWAMANGYSDSLTIDRIENDGNYEPSNCKWETNKRQANNRRSSRYLSIGEQTKTLVEWAEEYGIHPETIARRIKAGWGVESAIKTPVKEKVA